MYTIFHNVLITKIISSLINSQLIILMSRTTHLLQKVDQGCHGKLSLNHFAGFPSLYQSPCEALLSLNNWEDEWWFPLLEMWWWFSVTSVNNDDLYVQWGFHSLHATYPWKRKSLGLIILKNWKKIIYKGLTYLWHFN